MKIRNMEDRLAAIAAVIVLIGVSMAAEDALGREPAADLEVRPDVTMSLQVAGDE